MQLMNRNLWVVGKGIEPELTQSNKLVGWQSRVDRAKSIFETSCLGQKHLRLSVFWKLQLVMFKITDIVNMSSHINAWRALEQQLAKVGMKVEEDDAKSILLNICLQNTTM